MPGGIEYDINQGSFGPYGSHTKYDPSPLNKVGNAGQWWTQPDALQHQQAVGQQLSAGPLPDNFNGYLQGLGAKQAPFKYDTNVLSMSEHDGGRTFDYTRPNYSVGQHVPQPGQWNPPAGTGSHDNPDWAWKQNGYNRDEGNSAPNKFDPMYVDQQGGFLGYEEDMQRRYQDKLINALQNPK